MTPKAELFSKIARHEIARTAGSANLFELDPGADTPGLYAVARSARSFVLLWQVETDQMVAGRSQPHNYLIFSSSFFASAMASLYSGSYPATGFIARRSSITFFASPFRLAAA